MNYVAIIIQLIPLIVQLMKFAEQYFNSPKSGEAKKTFVVESVKALYGGAQGVSTGGQAETLAKVEPLVAPAVDIFASFLFPKEDR